MLGAHVLYSHCSSFSHSHLPHLYRDARVLELAQHVPRQILRLALEARPLVHLVEAVQRVRRAAIEDERVARLDRDRAPSRVEVA